MRVLEITGEPILHGGQEKFIANLIENMDDMEIEMDVLTPYICENEAFRELVEKRGGAVYELNNVFAPGKSRRFIYDIVKSFLDSHHYDAVHIHSGSISVLAYCAMAARDAGIRRRIVHSHCSAIPSLKHTMVRLIFGNLIKKNATDFLACSMVAGEDKYPRSIVKNKMILISNGIRINSFRRDDNVREEYRNKLGITDGEYVIGTVGRFSYQKNTAYLVEVLKKVLETEPKTRLLLVGDGELRDEVEQRAADLDVSERIIFTGNVDNVPDYYQVMDAFLLPSRFEGLPFVAIEAQAAGLPCMISTGVTKDAAVCENARMLSLEDQEEWVKAALECIREKPADNYEKLRDAGYDIENTISQVKQLYYL